MKFNSENVFLLSSAALTVVLATTSVSANKQTNANIQKSPSNNATYTASGTMNKKTAVMLTNLLRNPHLQVRAEINGRPLQTISPKPAMKNPINILSNYTITGKTDRATVLKLKKLLQNSQQLQITAEANFNKNTQRVANTPAFQGYVPFYSNIRPPAYVQGNTLWVPVLINSPLGSIPAVTPEMFAGK